MDVRKKVTSFAATAILLFLIAIALKPAFETIKEKRAASKAKESTSVQVVEPVNEREAWMRKHEAEIVTLCQYAVEKRIKSPSSFKLGDWSEIKFQLNADETIDVLMPFYSKNSFNAEVPSLASCSIKGEDSVKINSIKDMQ